MFYTKKTNFKTDKKLFSTTVSKFYCLGILFAILVYVSSQANCSPFVVLHIKNKMHTHKPRISSSEFENLRRFVQFARDYILRKYSMNFSSRLQIVRFVFLRQTPTPYFGVTSGSFASFNFTLRKICCLEILFARCCRS